jgi:antitoxin component of MazEF toxin-antitoxin module
MIRVKRKIISVGSSKSVTIPPAWLSSHHLTSGDVVDLIIGSVVVVKPASLSIDPQLLVREIGLALQLEKRERT